MLLPVVVTSPNADKEPAGPAFLAGCPTCGIMVSGTFDQQKAVFACQGGAIPHPRVEWSEDGNMDELQIEKIARMGLPS